LNIGEFNNITVKNTKTRVDLVKKMDKVYDITLKKMKKLKK